MTLTLEVGGKTAAYPIWVLNNVIECNRGLLASLITEVKAPVCEERLCKVLQAVTLSIELIVLLAQVLEALRQLKLKNEALRHIKNYPIAPCIGCEAYSFGEHSHAPNKCLNAGDCSHYLRWAYGVGPSDGAY